MKDVSIVIPAFNEENYIFNLVKEAIQAGFRCIVVDDGSVDDTAKFATVAGARVVVMQSNVGNGAALRLGVTKAFDEGADVVVTLDGDGAHRVSDVADVVCVHRTGGADLTIGSRFLDRSMTVSMPTAKVDANAFARLLFNGAMGTLRTDVASGFRVIGRRALSQLASDLTFGWTFEFLNNCIRSGLCVLEAPIGVRYDAMDPWMTSRRELVNFLDYIFRECVEFGDFRQAMLTCLESETRFAVLGPEECFILHVVRESLKNLPLAA